MIIVGGDPKAVRRLGFVPASTLDDALEIASDTVGRSPTITHLHLPPLMMADVKWATVASLDIPRHHLRRAARAAGRVERAVGRATSGGRNVGFPYRPPTVPRGVEVPKEPPSLGADYDTDWARNPGARVARGVIAEGPMRLRRAQPRRSGDLRRWTGSRTTGAAPTTHDGDDEPQPLIFAPNHHSHLDTALMVRAVPFTWRRRLVVAAAADYFFDQALEGDVSPRCR